MKLKTDILIKDNQLMGPVKSTIDDLNNQNEKKAKQSLQIAIKMITIRFQAFQAELNINIGPLEKLPGKYVIGVHKVISANVSKGSKDNKDAIDDIVKQFAKGDIAKGIVNALFTSLDMILGSYSASYDQTQDYIVLTNLIGGLFRMDYLVVQQKIQANAIENKLTSVFGSYLIISSVNKVELKDDNVYRILIDRQFGNRPMRDKFLLLKMLKEQQLTQSQMNEIYTFKYEDLEFEKGKLVEKNQKKQQKKNDKPQDQLKMLAEKSQYEIQMEKLENKRQQYESLDLKISKQRARISELEEQREKLEVQLQNNQKLSLKKRKQYQVINEKTQNLKQQFEQQKMRVLVYSAKKAGMTFLSKKLSKLKKQQSKSKANNIQQSERKDKK